MEKKAKKCEKLVVVHIYASITGQRQTRTPNYWTIRALFIAITTLWLEESVPA